MAESWFTDEIMKKYDTNEYETNSQADAKECEKICHYKTNGLCIARGCKEWDKYSIKRFRQEKKEIVLTKEIKSEYKREESFFELD